MISTKKFRDQHEDLLGVAAELSNLLDAGQLAEDGSAARSLLSKLLGKLSVHLAMEDKVLYPKLVSHQDQKIQALAIRFSDEMGSIGVSIKTFNTKWTSARAIQKEPEKFITEVQAVLKALSNRIDRENNELYSAVDRLP